MKKGFVVFLLLILSSIPIFAESDEFIIDLNELNNEKVLNVINGNEGSLLIYGSKLCFFDEDGLHLIGYHKERNSIYVNDMYIISTEAYLIYSTDGKVWKKKTHNELKLDGYEFDNIINLDGKAYIVLNKGETSVIIDFLDYFNSNKEFLKIPNFPYPNAKIGTIDAGTGLIYHSKSGKLYKFKNGEWLVVEHKDWKSKYSSVIAINYGHHESQMNVTNGEYYSNVLIENDYAIFIFDLLDNYHEKKETKNGVTHITSITSNLRHIYADISKPYFNEGIVSLFTKIPSDKLTEYNEKNREIIIENAYFFNNNYYMLWQMDIDKTYYAEDLRKQVPCFNYVNINNDESKLLRGFRDASPGIFNELYFLDEGVIASYADGIFTLLHTTMGELLNLEVSDNSIRLLTDSYVFESSNMLLWKGRKYGLEFEIKDYATFDDAYYTCYTSDQTAFIYGSKDLIKWYPLAEYKVDFSTFKADKTAELLARNGDNYAFRKGTNNSITSNDEELIVNVDLFNDRFTGTAAGDNSINLTIIMDKRRKIIANDALTDYKTVRKPNTEKAFYYVNRSDLVSPKQGEYYFPCLYGYVLKSNDLINYEATLQTRNHLYVSGSGPLDIMAVEKENDYVRLIARSGVSLLTKDFKNFKKSKLDNVDFLMKNPYDYYSAHTKNNVRYFKLTTTFTNWDVLAKVDLKANQAYENFAPIYHTNEGLLLKSWSTNMRFLFTSDDLKYYLGTTDKLVDYLNIDGQTYISLNDVLDYDLTENQNSVNSLQKYILSLQDKVISLKDNELDLTYNFDQYINQSNKYYIELNSFLENTNYQMTKFDSRAVIFN